MTMLRLLWESMTHYWRTNLAVVLGVVAGTAVISGALVVGDSVRESLRQMSLVRLGEIDHALHSQRFFREKLAEELAGDARFQQRFASVAPLLLMEGSFKHEADKQAHRANKVNVFGIDSRAWKMTNHAGLSAPQENEVLLSRRAADELKVTAGDDVSMWIELPSSIPRDSLLGERDETSREIPLTVREIIEDEVGVSRLELNPNQQLPFNAFVALDTLQRALDLHQRRVSRRDSAQLPARVNAMFVQAKTPADRTGGRAPAAAATLNDFVAQELTLDDLRLRLDVVDRGYVSLESDQMILDRAIAEPARGAAAQLSGDVRTSPVLVYLANELVNPDDPEAYSMYSIVAGLELGAEAPFGPFDYVGEPPQLPLDDDQIVLNDWVAADLDVEVDDSITLKYYEVGSRGELPEISQRFEVAGIVRLAGAAADRHLTPDVAGITDADTLHEWDQPFPMQLDRVTARDEEYWEDHRATPKAFVSLETALNLWRSRYGELTSIRIASTSDRSVEETADLFRKELLNAIEPEAAGLVFQPVKRQGLRAASGTTDFSGLFFGFSFFIILAAMILIGLLFRLGIERRTGSVGLLAALGFAPKQLRRLFLGEGLLLIVVGGVLGTVAAVAYAQLMVYGLKTWWFRAIGTKFLYVFVDPLSLLIGFVISLVVMTIAVWWAMRQLRGLSAREMLAGATEAPSSEATQQRRGRRARLIALVCGGLSAVLIAAATAGVVPNSEAFMGLSWYVVTFFIVGIALLAGSLSLLDAWLNSDRAAAVRGAGLAGVGRLGMSNAARHRQRSVLTVGLIASATFVIVAVAAGRRNPAAEEPKLHSGNGGFVLVAESSTPLNYDLDTAEGRDQLGIRVESQPGSEKSEDDAETSRAAQETLSDAQLLARMNAVAFGVRPGEDASCLNLYQTTLPTILGVPPSFVDRGGFEFANTPGDNPWELLTEPLDSGAVPVIGDMNTLMYSLHKSVGDQIAVPDAKNPEYTLEIVGMLDGSVLQGVLLMSEDNFRRLYPDRAGYQYFLIGDGRFADENANAGADARLTEEQFDRLSTLLETQLTAYGFDAEPVAARLSAFLAVQNTYLSTFQTLGGLGLLLGTLGLATVMLRNVLERRAELALFRAVGFTNSRLAWLVLLENALLLVWGLAAGAVSALLAMTPHLASTGADVPWISGAVLLVIVFAVGMAAALLAVREAVRTPVLATLRSE